MNMKIDWKQVARLVAGILSLAFIVGAIVFFIGVAPDMKYFIIDLFEYGFELNLFLYVLANFVYPLVLTATAVFIAIMVFFKRPRMLSVSVILYAVSCFLLCVLGFSFLQTGDYERIFWLLFGVNLVILLMYLPIIFDSFKARSYTLSKVLSVIAFVMQTVFVNKFSADIQ